MKGVEFLELLVKHGLGRSKEDFSSLSERMQLVQEILDIGVSKAAIGHDKHKDEEERRESEEEPQVATRYT